MCMDRISNCSQSDTECVTNMIKNPTWADMPLIDATIWKINTKVYLQIKQKWSNTPKAWLSTVKSIHNQP